MELSSPKIKKYLIFSRKKLFLYFPKYNISGKNFPSSKNKKTDSEKISYISGNKTFLP